MKTNLFSYYYFQGIYPHNSRIAPHNYYNDFLQNLFKVIEDNFDDSVLTVGFLAANLAVSRSTLNRKISLLTGLSANELIKQYRLQKAATLLVSGKTVSETAYLTGFETPSYFTQCFKEFYKITPKEYSRTIY
ncbi:MAG TPA: AraC family transcriptional regulator [Chitinophagaceae bacterium]|jgi:AraC-like DNA-binding protein